MIEFNQIYIDFIKSLEQSLIRFNNINNKIISYKIIDNTIILTIAYDEENKYGNMGILYNDIEIILPKQKTIEIPPIKFENPGIPVKIPVKFITNNSKIIFNDYQVSTLEIEPNDCLEEIIFKGEKTSFIIFNCNNSSKLKKIVSDKILTLRQLSINNNAKLNNIDFFDLKRISSLYMASTNIKIDLYKLYELSFLDISNNHKIKTKDFSKIKRLMKLTINGLNIDSVSNCLFLLSLEAHNSTIKSCTKCPNLSNVNIYNKYFELLELNENIKTIRIKSDSFKKFINYPQETKDLDCFMLKSKKFKIDSDFINYIKKNLDIYNKGKLSIFALPDQYMETCFINNIDYNIKISKIDFGKIFTRNYQLIRFENYEVSESDFIEAEHLSDFEKIGDCYINEKLDYDKALNTVQQQMGMSELMKKIIRTDYYLEPLSYNNLDRERHIEELHTVDRYGNKPLSYIKEQKTLDYLINLGYKIKKNDLSIVRDNLKNYYEKLLVKKKLKNKVKNKTEKPFFKQQNTI